MSNAKITLFGCDQYFNNINQSVFDNLVVPQTLNKETLVDNILLRGGEFELQYGDPYFIRNAIGAWSLKWQPTMKRWVDALAIQYNPLENYDRMEDWNDQTERSDASSASRIFGRKEETSHADSEAYSENVSHSDSEAYSEAKGHSENENYSEAKAHTDSEGYSETKGHSESEAYSESKGNTSNETYSESKDRADSEESGETKSITTTKSGTENTSSSTTTTEGGSESTSKSITSSTENITDRDVFSNPPKHTVTRSAYDSAGYEPLTQETDTGKWKENASGSTTETDTTTTTHETGVTGTGSLTNSGTESTSESDHIIKDGSSAESMDSNKQMSADESVNGSKAGSSDDIMSSEKEGSFDESLSSSKEGSFDENLSSSKAGSFDENKGSSKSASFAGNAVTDETQADNASSAMNNDFTHTGRIHGNIGVTTNQQMLMEELTLGYWNIYEKITELFLQEFTIPVYI